MKDGHTRTTVELDSGLFRKLKEIADRRHCDVDDLVEESIKARYRFYGAEERRAAVEEIEQMDLPASEWDEMESEIVSGAVEQ